jgi:D-alanine--D-alanine ligase
MVTQLVFIFTLFTKNYTLTISIAYYLSNNAKTIKNHLKGSIMHKLRVGVLMGGMSAEREVSFNSGRTICDHLDTTRYTIIPLFQTTVGSLYMLPWHFLHRGKISDFEHRLAGEACVITWSNLKNYIDFMYIATHGRYAEDGALQGFLEVLGIPYLGSKVGASAMRMDKIMHKNILRAHTIMVPRSIALYPEQIADFERYKNSVLQDLADTHIGFPCIVKPHREGSSLGIRYVFDEHELQSALEYASTIHPTTRQAVILEEVIYGMEFSCITLVDYHTQEFISLPPTEIIPESSSYFYDYEQKYMPGRGIKFTPARCTQEQMSAIQAVCIRVMQILEFTTLSRIDGFLTHDNKVVIIDPNSLSGMAPASFMFLQAAEINMSHTQVINHLIETELHTYGMLDTLLSQEKERIYHMGTPEKKVRIAVLMGGDSHEREISLESGRNIVYKLSPCRYEVLPIFVTNAMSLYHINQRLLVRNSTKEIFDELEPSMHISWDDLPALVDFVFIALHGGRGENGSVQGALEMLRMPYNGSSVLASALCIDKYKTTQYLKEQGFAVPCAQLVSRKAWHADQHDVVKQITQLHALPLIVKPHDDGCSVMVEKATTVAEVIAAIETIFNDGKTHALIEECVIGMELTVGVIGNENPQALPPSQAIARAGILSIAEKFLPGSGENQTPAPLQTTALHLVQRTMEAAYRAIGCKGYARIDCFYQNSEESPTGKERVVILEINSLPGLTPATCIFHQAAERAIKPMEFIDMIVEFGFQEHRQSGISTSSVSSHSTATPNS